MVKNLPIKTIHGDSIRILVTHACQERCNFCHNEGTDNYSHTPIDIRKIVRFVRKAKEEFGLKVVHLTGGEPTLHPQIVDLINSLKKAGFIVQMTTNGDLNPVLLNKIISAGIDSINFSLHAITPEDFKRTQTLLELNKKAEYYSFLMKRKISNIQKARKLVRVKLNTVVINEKTTGMVVDFALKQGIPFRLMRNLNDIEESEKIIEKVLAKRGLIPIGEQKATGDSGGSGIVFGFSDGKNLKTDIKVKKFGDVYLDSICNGCPLKHTPHCRERFYGIRIGVNSITLQNEVRLCIDRDDKEVIVNPQEIFKGKHYKTLKNNYVN